MTVIPGIIQGRQKVRFSDVLITKKWQVLEMWENLDNRVDVGKNVDMSQNMALYPT